MNPAILKADIHKHRSGRTRRHNFAIPNWKTVTTSVPLQEPFGHADLRTAMLYPYLKN